MGDIEEIKERLKPLVEARNNARDRLKTIDVSIDQIVLGQLSKSELESEISKTRYDYLDLDKLRRLRTEILSEITMINRDISMVLGGRRPGGFENITIHLK